MATKHASVICLALILFGAVLTTIARVDASQNTLSDVVDWNTVPATVLPQQAIDNPDLGQCICDVHAGLCDLFCCCDPDCSADEKSSFAGKCLPDKVSDRRIKYCVDREEDGVALLRANKRDESLDKEEWGADAVCIVRSTYPDKLKTFFKQPTEIVPNDLSTKTPEEWFTTTQTSLGSYKPGDALPFLKASLVQQQWRMHTEGNGFWAIPRATNNNNGGLCNRDKAAKFMEHQDYSACLVEGTLETLCSAASAGAASLGAGSLLTQQFSLLGIPLPGHSYPGGGDSIAPVAATFVSAADGTTVVGSVNPKATFDSILKEPNVTAAAAAAAATRRALLQTQTTATQRPEDTVLVRHNATHCTCKNALVAAFIDVAYSYTAAAGGGKVHNASVTAFVRDITSSQCSGPTAVNTRVAQEYSLRFVPPGARDATALPRKLEGRPGYTAGGSVLAAVRLAKSGKQTFQRRLGGFTLPAGGRCTEGRQADVKFMHSVYQTSCYYDTTEAELQGLCLDPQGTQSYLLEALRSSPLASMRLNDTVTLVDHLGRTGDAHVHRPTDWINILGIPWTVPEPAIYKSVLRRCDNLIVGLDYVFLVGRAGAEYNPQDVIVAAKVEPKKGSWLSRSSVSDAASTSRNYFKFSVTFKRFGEGSQATRMRRVVPPPILPEMSEDVFYPFRLPQ